MARTQYGGSWIDLSPAVPFIQNYIAADRQGEIMNAIKNQDLKALQEEPGFWQKLTMGADAYKGVKEAQDMIAAQQAAPFAALLRDMSASGNQYDPNFTGDEWVKGMMTTQAVGGKLTEDQYNALKTPTATNPLVPSLIRNAEGQAQEAADTHSVINSVNKGVAPDTTALTRFLTSGKGQMANGEKGVAGDSLYSKILTGGKQFYDIGKERDALSRDQAFTDALNNFITQQPDAANNPDAWNRAVVVNYNKFKPSADVAKTAFNGVEAMFPKLELKETGDVKGNDQMYAIDPRTGVAVPVKGTYPQDPTRKATKVEIKNFMPAQETEFAKGIGAANAKQYAGAIDEAAQSQKALRSLTDFETALQGTYSGKYAGVQYQTAKLMPNAYKNPKVVNYEIAQQGAKTLALDILTNFKGAISDGERKFATEMATNPSMEPAAQKKLIEIARREHNNRLSKANTLIKSVESMDTRSNINRTLQESQPVTLDAIAAERARRQKNGSN